MSARTAVLAVDGGNSKTDLALVTADGALRALVHGPTISHQQVPLAAGMERLAALAAEARQRSRMTEPAEIGTFCLAGADFTSDVRTLERGIGGLALARRVVVRNDGFAALRAGAPSGWGIAVVCGAGVNAVGVAPDGRRARLAGIGDLSGDWGGGYGLGLAALAAAVRAGDGRGDATSLAQLVPAHFEVRRAFDLSRAIYEERIAARRLEELAPVVFDAAAQEDAVARGIADRLADELATMAGAIARRLRIARREVDVVLAGGVFRTTEAGFYARLEERLRAGIPRARTVHLAAPPVLGAALLGLDELGIERGAAAERRLRRELSATS
jgi:N-acetylglucosamine kinase-like BadF-type ATPase